VTSSRSIYVRLALGIVAVSFGAIFVRMASEAAPFASAAWRLTLAAVVLVGTAALRPTDSMTWRAAGWCALSGTALALHFALWFSSLQFTSVSSSVLFMSTHPLFVGFGSMVLLDERPTRRLAGATALAILGGALIGFGDFRFAGSALYGDALAIGGGLMAAVYFMIGRRVRRTVSALEYNAATYAAAAVLTLLLCAATGTKLVGFGARTTTFLILLAVVPQLIGHSTLNWALAHLPASRVSFWVLGEPVAATVLALTLFNEVPRGLNIAGAALILVAIYLSLRDKEIPHVHRPHPRT